MNIGDYLNLRQPITGAPTSAPPPIAAPHPPRQHLSGRRDSSCSRFPSRRS